MTAPIIDAPIANTEIERAAKAIHALDKLCPELSIFANILIGRDPNKRNAVRVQPGPQTATDGNTIYIRPDGRLARAHLTEEQWSDIKASLFHEVAHIAFDTFAKASDTDRKKALEHVMAELPDSIRRDYLLRGMEASDSYWSLCAVFHPLMHMLVNALEDARVEALLFQAKPGTQKHLERQRMEIFDAPREEIVARIGTPWAEREPDQQALIGCYLIGAHYAPEGRLADQVAADLRSIEPVIERACTSKTVADVYGTAFEILSELQKLGYLRNGDERDADIGATEHQDTAPDGSPMQRAEQSGCPHPKAKIVPCDGEYCTGNCLQCGAHLISPPSAGTPSSSPEKGEESSEGDPKGGSDSSEGETGEDSHGEASEGASEKRSSDSETADAIGGGDGSSASEDEAEDGDDDSVSTSGGDGDEDVASGETSGSDRDGGDEAGAADITKAEREELSAEAEREVTEALKAAGGHDHSHGSHSHTHDKDDAALGGDAIAGAMEFRKAGYDVSEQPAAGVTRIKVRSGDKLISGAESMGDIDTAEVEAAIAQTMPELRQVLALNGLTGFTGGMRSGRVDTRALVRTATGHERVFGRFETAESRDYNFVLALDCSGSMGDGAGGGKPTIQRHVALAAADMLDRLGIPFSMFGYTGIRAMSGWEMDIYDVRKPGEPWDTAARKRLRALRGIGANLDGSTMQYARIQGRNSARNPNTEVVVLYFNDGGMPAENERAEARLIKWEVANQRRNNVHYVGVGVGGARDVERVGLELVDARKVTSGVRNMTAKIGELLGARR